ncbi:MAG: ABC transporter ATP-binding protein [Gaiellaceae bacterium]
MAEISYEGVSKVYDDGTEAVVDLDLAIADGEFMVMVGPSGCGKTTALRMLAGLEEITDGTIKIGDRIVNDLTPRDRDIAMVFQNYARYPHMTVEENLAFGLRLRKLPKAEIRERVHEAAEILEIDEYLKRKPRALSGGQRQRVAMGRALVREPQAFLMDEPLSNLDAKLRVQMRAEIHQLQRRLGVTTIYVTHDQIEAMTLGDRVAVMLDGRLQQVDTPQALYDGPVNEFVASFIGSPSINILQADLQADNGALALEFGGHRLLVDETVARAHPELKAYAGRKLLLGIRPEDFEDASLDSSTPPERRLKTTCDLTEPLGAEVLVHFTVSVPTVPAAEGSGIEADSRVHIGRSREDRKAGDISRVVARVSPRTAISEGSPIELAVDTSRLYFFDPETRRAL